MKTEKEIENLAAKILGWTFLLACFGLLYKFSVLLREGKDGAFLALFFMVVAFALSLFSFMSSKLNK